jgi:hypothetical protein
MAIADESRQRAAAAEAAKAAAPPTESIPAIYVDEKGTTWEVVATKRKNTTRIVIPKGVVDSNGRNTPKGSSAPALGDTGTSFSIQLSFEEFKKRLPAFPMGNGEGVPGSFMPKTGGGRRRTHRKSRARKTRRSRK